MRKKEKLKMTTNSSSVNYNLKEKSIRPSKAYFLGYTTRKIKETIPMKKKNLMKKIS